MKKRFAVLLLAVAILASACTSNQTDVPAMQERLDTARGIAALGTAQPDGLQTEPAPETAAPGEAAGAAARSILPDAAQLRPENGVWALGGNLVYFGQYGGTPTAYRVLAAPLTQTHSDGEDCLLLDCDAVLELMQFDDNFSRNEGQVKIPSEWKGSDIELWLNGRDFYRNKRVFSQTERNAIARTVLHNDLEGYAAGTWTYQDYGSIDYVFSLSAAEANVLYEEDAARAKDGCSICWWLRSAFGSSGNGAGSVHGDGHLCNNSITFFMVGVSPAFNVDIDAVLFASAIGTDKTLDLSEDGAMVDTVAANAWKLTLLDDTMTVQVPDEQAVTRNGSTITVPYACSGDGVTQISVMITDTVYPGGDAQVLYYGALQGVPVADTNGSGTFTLPSELENGVCGADYHAYILAEDVNGAYQTDYASQAWEISIPTA